MLNLYLDTKTIEYKSEKTGILSTAVFRVEHVHVKKINFILPSRSTRQLKYILKNAVWRSN